MKFEVVGIDYDNRIDNFMISARADYEWYLEKTQGSEENLAIQRDIIRGSKPYKNLRADLKMGCILPTIVLAVRNIDASVTGNYNVNDGFISATRADLDSLQNAIAKTTPVDVDIVDGLQRTNALRQTLAELNDDERSVFLLRSLRLEIWVNIAFFPLAYRMLLLNAGQRPMSMKHQIDILSGGLAEDLQDLPGIEIIRLKDHKRRVRPGQFHLSTLAQAFQAWMQRSPNVDRTNLVVETMVVDEALESLGIDLTDNNGNQRDGFRQFVDWLLRLDRSLGEEQNRFFGNDTVVLGFAAAIGFAHKNETLQDRLSNAMTKMIHDAEMDKENPLGVFTFEQIRKSIDAKRSNVGEATRALVFRAVREYIMQDGTSPMIECWTQSASMM
ncbi:hypothetical protein A6A04_04655 [Paramagnetospirillum marisnigri]|uniref:DGQHR domain-containing protein n=1 Tax=Paramagnetospirillum marisnigri TaxID=1285242 RepID=A0A178MH89_9PROT|nr:hypothetical protein [Paramagnetospirillum marisnigri]OAN48052.1 hypothetical protein A6A04_04655 [Paramagnetospirillum marisnigri]